MYRFQQLFLYIAVALVLAKLPANTFSQSNVTTSTVFIPLVTNSLPPLSTNWLERVNGYRLRAGVPPVHEDATLNGNCFEHARYMAENNHLTHNQNSSLPYASPAGQICAQKGNAWLGWGNGWTPADAIDSWMRSVGHRLWLLYPTTPPLVLASIPLLMGQQVRLRSMCCRISTMALTIPTGRCVIPAFIRPTFRQRSTR
jgi:hypothetical protein